MRRTWLVVTGVPALLFAVSKLWGDLVGPLIYIPDERLDDSVDPQAS